MKKRSYLRSEEDLKLKNITNQFQLDALQLWPHWWCPCILTSFHFDVLTFVLLEKEWMVNFTYKFVQENVSKTYDVEPEWNHTPRVSIPSLFDPLSSSDGSLKDVNFSFYMHFLLLAATN